MLLGYDALGRLTLGQISVQSTTTPPPPFAGWSQPIRKQGLSAALIASLASGFVPGPPPAQAAPVFTAFSQPQLLRPERDSQSNFEITPSTLKAFGQFSAFDQQRAFKDTTQTQFGFEIRPPVPTRISGFLGFAQQPARHQSQDIGNETAFTIYPMPNLPLPGGTSRKLVKGKLVNPLGTARQPAPPKIELKKPPLPPYPLPTKQIAPPRPPAEFKAVLPIGSALDLERQILNAQDATDVQNFLHALDQDEQDAADIAMLLAMLDDDLD